MRLRVALAPVREGGGGSQWSENKILQLQIIFPRFLLATKFHFCTCTPV